jgi:uncharacterized membrane protein
MVGLWETLILSCRERFLFTALNNKGIANSERSNAQLHGNGASANTVASTAPSRSRPNLFHRWALKLSAQNSLCRPSAAAHERLARVLNWTHIHLILNHVPVIGLAVPIGFLLTDWARKSRKLEWLSLQLFVVFALLTIPVYLTGSPASHHMREMPGISLETIHRHSSAADFAFYTMEGLGAFSLAALYKFRSSAAVPPRLTGALLALALATLGLMIWTANLGGKIRHPEIGDASAAEHLGLVFRHTPSLPLATLRRTIHSEKGVSHKYLHKGTCLSVA